jgi:FKBP-type peptidyl-prolyl cis-trans isomerase
MIGNYLRITILGALVVGMVSCNNGSDSDDEKKILENEAAINNYLGDSLSSKVSRESNGIVYYKRVANPAGTLATPGDEATVKLNGYLLNGTKVLSVDKDSSISFPVGGGTTNFGGVELGVLLMRTGESASMFLPYYLAYGYSGTSSVPAYSPIRLEMKLLKLRTEVQQINDFIASKQFNVSERTADNLVIIRTNTVTGDTLGSGKSVNVKYVGRLLDGTKFDEGSLSITTNAGGTIKGFDRAVRKMRRTEKAIVIFPSALGYGKVGQRGVTANIYPYSPLQFELEIL